MLTTGWGLSPAFLLDLVELTWRTEMAYKLSIDYNEYIFADVEKAAKVMALLAGAQKIGSIWCETMKKNEYYTEESNVRLSLDAPKILQADYEACQNVVEKRKTGNSE
jgi:hypothetical protein